jgi:hypothetical protein
MLRGFGVGIVKQRSDGSEYRNTKAYVNASSGNNTNEFEITNSSENIEGSIIFWEKAGRPHMYKLLLVVTNGGVLPTHPESTVNLKAPFRTHSAFR